MAPPFHPWPEPWLPGWTVLQAQGRSGAVPNGLEPGDVLLFCRANPTSLQSQIVSAQVIANGGAARAHACFSHVAIFTGNSHVYDAAPHTDVATRRFSDVAGSDFVRARRLRGVTSDQQREILVQAHALQGRYAYLEALVDVLLSTAHVSQPYARAAQDLLRKVRTGINPKLPFHCSSLVQETYVNAVNVSVIGLGIAAALPCVFSADPQFEEVPIHW